MSLVKAKELRELSGEELNQRLGRLRKEYYELLQKKEIGQLDRPHRFGHIRREIGKILTVAGEQRRSGKQPAAVKPAGEAKPATKAAAKPAAKPASKKKD